MVLFDDQPEKLMNLTMAWEKQPFAPPGIAGERRGGRRYGIQLDLTWKLVRRCRLFDTGRDLPEGLNVELSIAWPVLLHDVAPLQLTVAGRIVRCEDRIVAIEMVQHEFRTAGMSAEHRMALAAVAPHLTASCVQQLPHLG